MEFTCGPLQVVDRNVKPLLGFRDSVKLGYVTFSPDVHALSQQEAPELLEYKDLFDNNNIRRLPVVYHMHLDDTASHRVRSELCDTGHEGQNCGGTAQDDRAGGHHSGPGAH